MVLPPPGLDRLAALITEESYVTGEQRAAIESDGDFQLVACPGSGKTRTAGIRAAWVALSRGWRVAATSYTNVAVAQIREAAASAGAVLADDHFCGTLHSMLLRFVFYPFGHLVMGCDARPTLVIDPADCPIAFEDIWLGDDAFRGSLWMFDYRRDGSFGVNKPQSLRMDVQDILSWGSSKAETQKQELFGLGYASRSDAMFVAMKVLEARPDIAALVAARFDEIIIDEAQDTSDTQLRCLELLKQTGRLRSIVLVTDPAQSIYEWQGSDPTACARFSDDHGMTTLTLTKNFRSSQAICDVTHRLAGRAAADEASGDDRDFGIAPEIILYASANGSDALGAFENRLNELSIDPLLAPILTRTESFANRLNRVRSPDVSASVKLLGTAAAQIQEQGSLGSKDLLAIETMVRRIAWGSTLIEDVATRIRLRDEVTKLVRALPSLDDRQDLRSWIAAARDCVKTTVAELTDDPVRKPGNVIRSKPGHENKVANKVFVVAAKTGRARTIHSAKGESHPAVLLAAPRATKDRQPAREWIKAELGEDVDEEARVAYVALTRARKYCAVALPTNTPQDVIDAYIKAGFHLRSID